MTKEEKQLLLVDLCARLPYGIYVWNAGKGTYELTMGNTYLINLYFGNFEYIDSPIKPYLRSMSSMTKEEEKELQSILGEMSFDIDCHEKLIIYTASMYDNDHYFSEFYKIQDWLNEHHFDYRGLILMGLALVAPEGMYKNKMEN